MKENNSEKKNKAPKIILIIIAILLILAGIGIMLNNYLAKPGSPNQNGETEQTAIQTTVAEVTGTKNPIDFTKLQKENEEIFAWIKVPGTKVDYPILQSAQSDEFYLKHRSTDKQYSASGAIFIQSMNNKDLNDRVTLIYGHNGYSGQTFFTTLHNFEDKEFFDKQDKFYIYTPTSKLTYKVVSAFKYDDRHIMNSFDFSNETVFTEFAKMIQNPNSVKKNVRSYDKGITKNDKIVILSTCFTGQSYKNSRYLVCGVLESNEKTN